MLHTGQMSLKKSCGAVPAAELVELGSSCFAICSTANNHQQVQVSVLASLRVCSCFGQCTLYLLVAHSSHQLGCVFQLLMGVGGSCCGGV